MKIQKVADASFHHYGKVVEGYDCSKLLKKMEHTPLPEGIIYEPSVEELEILPITEELRNRMYGGLPIQIGYCNGKNKFLNAVEYHRCSEINIAVTDMVLLLGSQQDVEEDFTYDTAKIEAFLVPAGTMVELYATTLHYAPCNLQNDGFQCVVVLPKDTNTEFDFSIKKEGEDQLLVAKNKWLIAHEDANIKGAFCGLKGVNLSIE